MTVASVTHVRWIPPLLYVYWTLHAIHLVLAAIALCWSWQTASKHSFTAKGEQTSVYRTGLRSIAPWAVLAFVFYMPGAYLEWPADVWEHLRRITEWETQGVVGSHSAGYKSLYFFAYSWIAPWPSGQLLRVIDFYYVAASMTLAWQYYLLARALGFEGRWALMAVAVTALTFGNASFSFFRYYGLASTLFAQIGAIAAIRLAICVFGNSSHADAPTPSCALRRRTRAYLAPAIAGAMLTLLIASNHRQGLGIAAFGICAIILWRIHLWSRRATVWLVVGALVLNTLVLLVWSGGTNAGWSAYQSGVTSPVFVRGASQVLGAMGWLNLAVGSYLLYRGDASGFLTIIPALLLAMPAGFLPLSEVVARNGASITQSRVLFAIPPGFALLAALRRAQQDAPVCWSNTGGFLALMGALGSLTIPGPTAPQFNRTWNALAVVPSDLRFTHLTAATTQVRQKVDARPVATDAVAAVYQSLGGLSFDNRYRVIGQPIASSTSYTVGATMAWGPTHGGMTLTDDPLSERPEAWITLGGVSPLFVAALSTRTPTRMAMQNPAGLTSEVFTKQLIPIDSRQRYRVEMSVLRVGPANAPTYLALAWYDREGRLLPSNSPGPAGAGYPNGWRNGTFSYFGLIGQTPRGNWTTYRLSFGPGEAAAIPPQAAFARAGALLNYSGSADGTVQLTNVRLWPKSPAELKSDGHAAAGEARLIICPDWRSPISPVSIAGLASEHWPASQVPADHAGVAEIRRAATAHGGELLGTDPWRYLIAPQRGPAASTPPIGPAR